MRTFITKFDEDKNICFLPDSLELFLINNQITEIINTAKDKNEISKVLLDIPNRQIKNITDSKVKTDQNKIISYPDSHLSRLVIHISNSCNLKCKYCYANEGIYGSNDSLMSIATLRIVLDKFYQIFDKIDSIQLFGGEPSLNMSAIEFTANYLFEKNHKTRLGMVTNGTLIDQKFIELVKKYDLDITVSIDSQLTHNLLRPFSKNKPSWKLIKNNIKHLQSQTNQPSQLEITYTKVHEDQDISLKDLVNELSSEFGDINLHIVPVSSENSNYKLKKNTAFQNSVHDLFPPDSENKNHSYNTLNALILSMKYKRKNIGYCGAGIGTLAVSTVGKIYPCFYFVDNSKFEIGSINDEKEALKKSLLKVRKKHLEYKKNESDQCKDCYANTICHGCLGANYTSTGNAFISSNEHCTLIKGMLENLLKELAFFSKKMV